MSFLWSNHDGSPNGLGLIYSVLHCMKNILQCLLAFTFLITVLAWVQSSLCYFLTMLYVVCLVYMYIQPPGTSRKYIGILAKNGVCVPCSWKWDQSVLMRSCETHQFSRCLLVRVAYITFYLDYRQSVVAISEQWPFCQQNKFKLIVFPIYIVIRVMHGF